MPSIAHEQETGVVFTTPALSQIEISEHQQKIPEILVKIAVCESRDKHFDSKGDVLKGGGNKYDIGKYQINILYWGDLADELGYDIYTEKGNEAMALEIYNRYGTSPWKWSMSCWSK